MLRLYADERSGLMSAKQHEARARVLEARCFRNALSDWVRNLKKNPKVSVRVAGEAFEGRARVVEAPDEGELARRLLVEKYERRPGSLVGWRRRSLPVAVEF